MALEAVAATQDLATVHDALAALPESFHEDLASVEHELQTMLAASGNCAAQAARHLLIAGGKRVRPLLCLLAARTIPQARSRARGPAGDPSRSENREEVRDVAPGGRSRSPTTSRTSGAADCASFAICSRDGVSGRASSLGQLAQIAEMIHGASLLHDDVIDLGRERRGRPASRMIFGNAASVLGGDLLMVRAMAMAETAGIPCLLGSLLQTLGRMVAAEALQLERRCRTDVTLAEHFEIVEGKTAALFAWAAEAGARAIHSPENAVTALRTFGHELGMAFQLVDDLLDLEQDPETIGKGTMQDLQAGTLTLPVIHAARHRPERIALLSRTDMDAGQLGAIILQTVAETGGFEAGRKEVRLRTGAAVKALAALPLTPARLVMETLAGELAGRVC